MDWNQAYLQLKSLIYKYYALLQQVNDLEINPSSQMVAACGYQHIRMYDLASANPDPVMNFEGVIKNVSRVGFQVDWLLF